MRFLFAAVLACAGTAQAQGTWEPVERIRAAALAAVQADAAPGERTLATVAVDDQLRMPQCGQAPVAGRSSGSGAGQTVAVSCAGPAAWSLYVPVRVQRLRSVLTLQRSLNRGDGVAAEALAAEERDIAQLPYGYFTEPAQVAGQLARRPLSVGSVLTPGDLEAPRLVRRGQIVTLVGRSGGIVVRMQGKALADGVLDQAVTVQNGSSKRVVQGVVRAGGVVEVAL